MITYLAPGRGRGHTTRAVAVCRHLEAPVRIVATTPLTEILEWSGLAFDLTTRARISSAADRDDFVIADLPYTPEVRADVWVTRFGYPEPPRGAHVLRTEGPGALWPIVLLEPDELLERSDARQALLLEEHELVALVPSILFRLDRVRRPYDVVLDRFPALRYLRAFDRIVGAPGQLYNECAAAGVAGDWICADSTTRRTRAEQTPPEFTSCAGRVAAGWLESLL